MERELKDRLDRIQSTLNEVKAKADRTHEALFEVGENQPKDTEPLIETLKLMALTYVRSAWTLRVSVRFLMLVAAVGAAAGTVWGWTRGTFKL